MPDEQPKRPWFAEDVRDAWKWASAWIGIILGALPQIYDAVPWLQAHITVVQFHMILSILAAGGVINTVKNKEPK